VNWRHFSAVVWLRWRMRVNQIKKQGIVNAVITAIFVAGMIPGAFAFFVGAFCAGALAVPLIPAEHLPRVLTYIWDGIALAFLFAWMIGLMAELQRSEALSMSQFLHLPVSLSSVFIINYLSSLVSLNLLIFVPPMIGFIFGLAVGVTPLMLLVLPLLAAFLLAVTALTYQFQGWLATLMANPRRRRTIIVGMTMAMILVAQVPNLINMTQPWNSGKQRDRMNERLAEQTQLNKALTDHEIDAAEFTRRQEELNRKYEGMSDSDRKFLAQAEVIAQFLNFVLPPGWLPLGAGAAAEGNVVPALLGTLGLGVIGTASLWRAYRTTIRLYTGAFTQQGARRAPAPVAPHSVAAPKGAPPAGTTLLERQLPWVSEHASAIALAGFRSVLRAPEAKMILLTPLILVIVFGSMLFSRTFDPPVLVRPLMAFGAMAMVLIGLTQILGNQFGFDRSGFRVFVLCPAPRSDILLGKNLALAPVALGLGGALILVLEILAPMRIDHIVLVLPQCVAMFLLYCLIGNMMSIFAPMPVAASSMKISNPKMLYVLLQVAFATMFPLVMSPLLVPIGVDALLEQLGWAEWLPAGLILMAIECAVVVLVYHFVIGWQGKLLHDREQRILEIVTTKAE
jgi:ABC-2 type transport system permease protein